ncbi:MAG: hypothetical protein ACFFB5_20470 [Promethearchaeota archaeon]
MTESLDFANSKLNPRIRIIMMTIAIIIVFVFPYGIHIDLGVGPSGVMAILWEYREFQVAAGDPDTLFLTALEYFIYYLYRFVVLYMIWKYTLGKEQPKKVIFHGLICELISLLIDIPAVLFREPGTGHNYIPIMIPIPFLLIYCIILAYYDYYHKNMGGDTM